PQAQVDPVLRIEVLTLHRNPLFRCLAGKVVLGKIGAVDGWRLVIADHADDALISLAAQPFGRREAGRTATDDDNPARCPGGPALARLRGLSLTFLADKDHAAALLHRPAGERTEGRRADGFSGAKLKAGMLPPARSEERPVGERDV